MKWVILFGLYNLILCGWYISKKKIKLFFKTIYGQKSIDIYYTSIDTKVIVNLIFTFSCAYYLRNVEPQTNIL